ncbi:glycine cleavage T C-terminal barrel domain-containing protein [Tepidicaulis sp. LMO-SS28]|uniref:glycine cleavage T C-terminal barrel domain-containing protein n=1 Tax=Tepidicaulis sp. LMO-SS28 TaxID=3447455 RepID=UPI003EDFBE4A
MVDPFARKEEKENKVQAVLEKAAPAVPGLFGRPDGPPPYTAQVLPTCLHSFAAAACRTNAWRAWNGFTTPDTYVSLAADYEALRMGAGLVDLSWQTVYRISGTEAEACLQRLMTCDVTALADHGSTRAFWCGEDGRVVGEGMLMRLARGEYRLSTAGDHADWFMGAADGFNALVEDVTGTLGCIALAGPEAGALVRASFGLEAAALEEGAALWSALHEAPVYVARTGALQEESFELWTDAEDAPVIWTALLRAHGTSLHAAGFAACDLVRLERGRARWGMDYRGAECALERSSTRTPFELAAGRGVDFEKGPFIGREALLAAREKPGLAVVALEAEQSGPARLTDVYAGGKRTGCVTSCGWSPVLCTNIALAVLDAEALSASGSFEVEAEFEAEIGSFRRRLAAHIAPRPLIGAAD